MNLNLLRVFHAVASHRSFSKASSELLISQPGISKHVRHLEEHLNTKLFDRLGKTISLTPTGKILFESAHHILNHVEAAEKRIKDFEGKVEGAVQIGASYTAGTHIIPSSLCKFINSYPGVDLTLKIDLSHKIADDILCDDIDIGFLGSKPNDEKLKTAILCNEELAVILPPDHRWKKRKSISIYNLSSEPFVISGLGSGTRSIIEAHLAEKDIQPARLVEFGNTEAVKKAVAAGMGITILSKIAVESEVASNQLIVKPIADCDLKRTFYIAYNKRKYLTNAMRALLDFFAEYQEIV